MIYLLQQFHQDSAEKKKHKWVKFGYEWLRKIIIFPFSLYVRRGKTRIWRLKVSNLVFFAATRRRIRERKGCGIIFLSVCCCNTQFGHRRQRWVLLKYSRVFKLNKEFQKTLKSQIRSEPINDDLYYSEQKSFRKKEKYLSPFANIKPSSLCC